MASIRIVRLAPIQQPLQSLKVQLGALRATDLVAGAELRGGRLDHRLRLDVEPAAAREREDLRLAGALEKIQALERLHNGGDDDRCSMIGYGEDVCVVC